MAETANALNGNDTHADVDDGLQADTDILPRILDEVNEPDTETHGAGTPEGVIQERKSGDNSPSSLQQSEYTYSLETVHKENGDENHINKGIAVSISKPVPEIQMRKWKETTTDLNEISDLPLALVRNPIKAHNSSNSQSPKSLAADGPSQQVSLTAHQSPQAACETPLSAGFAFNQDIHTFAAGSPGLNQQMSTPSQGYNDGVTFYNQLEQQTRQSSANTRFDGSVDYGQENEPTKTFSNLIPSPTAHPADPTGAKSKHNGNDSFTNNVPAHPSQPWNAYTVSATTASIPTSATDYTNYQQFSDYSRHYTNPFFEGQRPESDNVVPRINTDLETLQQCQGLQQHIFAGQHNFTFNDTDKYLHETQNAVGKSSQVASRPNNGEDSSLSQRIKAARSIPADPLRWTELNVKSWLTILTKTLDGPEVLDVDEVPDVTGRELCNMTLDEMSKFIRSSHVATKVYTELAKRREAVLASQSSDDTTPPAYSRYVPDPSPGSSQNSKSDI